MSHIPQRKEKDCLNCGTIVQGHYCHHCGQENVVPHETFWHMVKHFLYDITHFDSNFFGTIHHLALKPGFLSREYIKGRRASYLHPVKMYVFTSAIFFLLFFSVFAPSTSIKTNMNDPLTADKRSAYLEDLEQKLKKDPGNKWLAGKLAAAKDSTQVVRVKDAVAVDDPDFEIISFTDRKYKTREEYDSIQNGLPQKEQDGWFMRRLVLKQIQINAKYRENPDEATDKVVNSILHRLPYMLFVSLPLFAFLLNLVYIRRKQFYFADHGIFTIHLYVFTFLLLLVVFLFDKLEDITHWGVWGILTTLFFLLLFFYLYKAMRNFYGQKRGKTILKFILVSVLSLLMMTILFLVFAFFSAFTI